MADLLIKKIQIGSQAYSIYDERVQKPVPANAKFTDTTYGAEGGITLASGNKFKHTNSVDAVSSSSLLKITYDAYGHITGSSAVTSEDIAGLGVQITDNNTTYKLTIGTTTKGDTEHGVDLGTLVSKDAKAGSTDLSLVTTGEKAAWNAKTSNTGTVTSVTGTQGLTGSGTTTATLKANLKSYTPNSNVIGGKLYGVELDKDGKLAVNVPWTDTNTKVTSVDNHYKTNGFTAKTSDLYKLTIDAAGHITAATKVQKSDITTLGIPGQDTTYGAEKGISLSSEGKFGHSNTAITAVTDAVFKKIKYDAYGHITGTEDVKSNDITPLIADATKQITTLQTLVNKIKAELENPSAEGGLTSVLDTMQAVLNTSANAVTGVNKAAYGTTPSLSVNESGVLSFNPGTIIGGTVSSTKSFVTSSAS